MGSLRLKVGILPGLAELYNKSFSRELLDELKEFITGLPEAIGSSRIDFEIAETASTEEHMKAEAAKLIDKNVHLIVLVLAPYCPSGVIAPALNEHKIPLLLWPAQTVFEFNPEQINAAQICLSHGVHGVQDSANILRKRRRPFCILHGHYLEDGFCEQFEQWTAAAGIYTSFLRSNPLQIGGYFNNMLDLQIDDAPFLTSCGIKINAVNTSELEAELKTVAQPDIERLTKRYKKEFAVADNVTDTLLEKAARGELAINALLKKFDSHACGINFETLCSAPAISDAMHLAACRLMADGKGYAGEGDWVTAAFIYALQSALKTASFTEIFSVDYKADRVLLKHWGEANPRMAAGQAEIIKSMFKGNNQPEFCIVSMQFTPGPATLINLNSNPEGTGQLISIYGHITDDVISNCTGPRAMFRPERSGIHEILDSYAYAGGSHHLALVEGNAEPVLKKLSLLAGWDYKSL